MQRSSEYGCYFIGRGYEPQKVFQQFAKVGELTRETARQPKKDKENRKLFGLVTKYNPILPNLNQLIRKNLPLLYSDPALKTIFPEGSVKPLYKRGKNLKELLSPSIFPRPQTDQVVSNVSKCTARKCDICTNFMIFGNRFVCTATGRSYSVKGALTCNSDNVIYLVTCQSCKLQYVGSATSFKERFRVHKSDINTHKIRCGVVKHFTSSCNLDNTLSNLKVQLIECLDGNVEDLEGKLWQREKYWQAQLFTMSHGLNSLQDWYSTNRKGYRKN